MKKFQLNHILDQKRDDYTIINQSYENTIIFTVKNIYNKTFMFNFCTLFYYELAFFEYEEKKHYKIKKKVGYEIPINFKVYCWKKDEQANIYIREKYKILN